MCTLHSKVAVNFRQHGGFFLKEGETAVCPDTLPAFVQRYIEKLVDTGVASVKACDRAMPKAEAKAEWGIQDGVTQTADQAFGSPEPVVQVDLVPDEAPADMTSNEPLLVQTEPSPDTHSYNGRRHGKRRR
jgi:hypothetical protein